MGPLVSQRQEIEKFFSEATEQAKIPMIVGPIIYLSSTNTLEIQDFSPICQEHLLTLAGLNLGPKIEEENQAVSNVRQATHLHKENLPALTELDGDSPTGSPPGFLGPPRFARSPVRYNACLSLKNKGPYLCPEERAHQISKPYTVSFHKKRQTRKHNSSPVKLDYLKSFEPLSDNQAEAVIAQASIELYAQMEKIAMEAVAVE